MNKSNKGFTLIEMMIVLVISGILISLGVGSVSTIRSHELVNTTSQDILNRIKDARNLAINGKVKDISDGWVYGYLSLVEEKTPSNLTVCNYLVAVPHLGSNVPDVSKYKGKLSTFVSPPDFTFNLKSDFDWGLGKKSGIPSSCSITSSVDDSGSLYQYTQVGINTYSLQGTKVTLPTDTAIPDNKSVYILFENLSGKSFLIDGPSDKKVINIGDSYYNVNINLYNNNEAAPGI